MKAYQGHKLGLMNTAPLVFDSRAGLTIRNSGSYSEIFSQLQLDL